MTTTLEPGDDIERAWLDHVITRFLAVGTPPTAISKALNIDIDYIKSLVDLDHITKFGTAELAEAMNYLIWRAYEDALSIIETAPVDKRMRMDTALLARASSIVHGQEPDSMAKIKVEMAQLALETTGEIETGTSIYAVDSVDAPTHNPEERPQG